MKPAAALLEVNNGPPGIEEKWRRDMLIGIIVGITMSYIAIVVYLHLASEMQKLQE